MNLKRQILTLVTILAFVSSNAKIVTWSISPNYQEIKRYNGDMYLFQNNGKWGIVTPGDKVLLQANYDNITQFNEGYSLAYNNENGRQVLKCIISENGQINGVSEKYYLNDYKIFSEGLMPIANKSGKYGYIDPSGEIVIKCQFDEARIFRNGRAPIKLGNYCKYIKNNSDVSEIKYLVTDENFHDGDITHATCFYEGKAAIRYNKDCALIGTNGKKIKKLTFEQYNEYKKLNNNYKYEVNGFATSNGYDEFSDNGKLGLRQGDNIIVTPQFDSFDYMYSDGNILATLNGKQGVLRINEGDVFINVKVNGVHSSELEADRKGNINPITFECNIPDNLTNYRILFNDGSGALIDKTSVFEKNGNLLTFTSIPSVSKNAEECETRIVVEQGGIVLADKSQHFLISYPIKLRVSEPGPEEVRANENDTATVSSKIFNDSNKSVTVRVTWSNKDTSSVSIPAHGSRSVSTKFEVITNYEKDVSIVLSTGDSAHRKITFIKYL